MFLLQAFVFQESSECVAFLVNKDKRKNATIHFQNSSYELPPLSISILPDCKTVVFNTAKASYIQQKFQTFPVIYRIPFTFEIVEQVSTQFSTRSMEQTQKLDSVEKWEEYKEDIPNFDETSLRANMLLEQMNTTKDVSDYLWYNFR